MFPNRARRLPDAGAICQHADLCSAVHVVTSARDARTPAVAHAYIRPFSCTCKVTVCHNHKQNTHAIQISWSPVAKDSGASLSPLGFPCPPPPASL